MRNQSQADLKVETRRMCTGTRWIRSRRPELKGELAKSTGRDQGIRTGRFSTEEKSE
ncbi:MAG: hypothetical protein HOK62_01910 [Verrucomicrobiales bacterium]|nr:hypothetical protein [Verrucomicrobiales bacterium]MBT5845720.1 hypothetical protein [Verrucomicrobiales bacterium]MBT6449460.1 hypothetical protein [Verrucomicrobiales bacterium]